MKVKYFFLIIVPACLAVACQKQKETPPVAAISVVNTAVNAGAVKVNYFGTPIIWATYTGNVNTTNSAAQVITPSTLNFSTYGKYGVRAGNAPIVIVPVNDTLTPLYNNSISVAGGDVYSLYLVGQSPAFETMLVKEQIPVLEGTDSSVNVRFINLVPNSGPVNVNLSTTTTVQEFSNISYKGSSEFKKLAAKAVNGAGYIFQVKDAATGTQRASFTLPLTTTRFHTVTLVFKGLIAGTGSNAPGVLQVNNF